ncbi:MAG: ParB/RepB/Spo0J family partition protein [Proteobacteria bacterium]|nr:ParB/RepB/Spo0J family partition protein [Pseudomonadota bacterium]
MTSFTHPANEHAPPPGVPKSVLPEPIPRPSAGVFRLVPVGEIKPSPFNPRTEASFDKADLAELGETFKAHGVLEPILLRPVGKGFELMGGERRWRAAKVAGLAEIPAIVREATDDEAMVLQIIENHQRKDLTPIEEANSFVTLQKRDPKTWTAAAIGKAIGRSDRFVAQRMALVTRLDAGARKMLEQGDLSVEKARVLAVAPAHIQKGITGNRWNLENLSADQLREHILEQLVPEDVAAFDVARYKGGWHEEGKKRYFTDVEQFTKLQKEVLQSRLTFLRAAWPNAKEIDQNDSFYYCWADTGDRIRSHDKREAATGKFKVPQEKATAVIWLDNTARIRVAEGVVDSNVMEKATRRSGHGDLAGGRSETADHRRRRLAFLKELREKLNGNAELGLRVVLAMLVTDRARVGYERSGANESGLPEALKKIADSKRWDAGRDVQSITAVDKLDLKDVQKCIALYAGQAVNWTGHEPKPSAFTAHLAGLLKVEVAPPEPAKTPAKATGGKPTPKKAAAHKAKAKAKAKKPAAKKKGGKR